MDQNAITVNWSPPGQNGHHFTDDSFRGIFVNQNIFIIIPLTFVPNIDLDNGLMPNIQKAIICAKAYPIHRRIYAAPGGYGLRGNITIT